MKRKGLFRVLSLVLAFCLAALPVAAENLDDWEDLLAREPVFADKAAELEMLGLLEGTGAGLELDRQPTRAEVAVMLVRMLGLQASVQGGTYAHPFTDVPGWASPFVGYLYENGITAGVSDTHYGSQDPCTAQMYCAFTLRMLGYYEKEGHFAYAEAIDFAYEKGLISSDAFLARLKRLPFWRDDMAAITYNALFVTERGYRTTLFDRLCAMAAVNEEAAERLFTIEKVLEAKVRNEEMDEVSYTYTKTVSFSGVGTHSETTKIRKFQYGFGTGGEIKAGDCYTTIVDGVKREERAMYYYDGVIYENQNGTLSTVKGSEADFNYYYTWFSYTGDEYPMFTTPVDDLYYSFLTSQCLKAEEYEYVFYRDVEEANYAAAHADAVELLALSECPVEKAGLTSRYLLNSRGYVVEMELQTVFEAVAPDGSPVTVTVSEKTEYLNPGNSPNLVIPNQVIYPSPK
ncbi:MAG: S-layer homology domain-containing protein [Clostridia bacterium]|nr:S-layer homology domain-containing protein [Clostridia bacterium]